MSHRTVRAGLTLATVVAVSACTNPATPQGAPTPAPASAEVSGPRVAATYDGGLMVLDGESLKLVSDIPSPGFLRLNSAGDERHALVSTTDGFRLLDTGVDAKPHGDHKHYYASEPKLTETLFPAPKPGHAVRHDGKIALFSDEAGTVQVHQIDQIAKGPRDKATWTAPSPHHGVAVPLNGDKLLVSVGNDHERTGAAVVDATGATVAAADNCPNLHGESVAAKDRVVVGCTDGALIWAGDRFTKVKSPDAYGRIGNQAGSALSPITLGDYKVDKNAELERPTRVSLINTEDPSLRLVELGSSYSFRSLGRGPKGEALVLSTDGNLIVIDPVAGRITDRIKVTDAWQEPFKWQKERPTLATSGDKALVTEPGKQTVHVVDLESKRLSQSVRLPHAPNEITPLAEGDSHEHHG